MEREEFKFYFKDTGSGIQQEKLKKMLERFEQLNNKIQGPGLGWTRCKMIVEAKQGEIDVESEEGKGSKFCAYLPCEIKETV